ncbi:thiosulfate oxidation carrier complex protein SoxZ [Azorhizobium sp. AG788]|uniref:thiosulfate oxidation carrier complex protein SoxZ n=1 Tax=Azorhizobium sp. AG788 TaxID=2183897 RepID=UPI003139A847
MAIKSAPRVRVPAQAKAGELIEIKTLISHEMESGQRKDAAGKTVPRDIINTFEASFNGRPFFKAEWFPSISANPYQSFFYKATESGEFTFSWKDDAGAEQKSTAKLTVA